MSQITELLRKTASLEKQAYVEFVRSLSSNSIAQLVNIGIPFEKAAGIVKEACYEADEVTERAQKFQLWEKTAEYVEQLEQNQTQVKPEVNPEIVEPLNKLANLGFSEAELEKLHDIDQALLTKVANAVSSPESMGSAVGFAREKTDPLLEFLVG